MRDPSESDLKGLAARCFPAVSRVLTAHPMAVEDTLRRDLGLPVIRRRLSPGELLVLNAAIAGLLITSTADEFKELREYVAEWWRVNAQNVRGMQDS